MKRIFILGLSLFLFTLLKSQIQSSSDTIIDKTETFTFKASYVGDFENNFTGGIKTGRVYLGMANLMIGFDTEAAKLWKGGLFFINGASTHGESPTNNLTGDFQVISNIDAGDHIYMHEFWYKQNFSTLEFIIGLQDLNADFANTENGGVFINSSFGIPPVISNNIPAPIFPLTGLGFSFKYTISDHFTYIGALFDGRPNDFKNNKYNLNWNLNDDEGALAITEIQFRTNIHKLSGVYKAGYYYHTGLSRKDTATVTINNRFKHNYGFYIIADQNIWKKNEQEKLNIFTQIALSPKKLNNHNYYIGGGLNYWGIFTKSAKDAMGLALAYAGFHNGMHKHETTIEAYYKAQVTKNIFLQPDIQYVINPSGSDEKLNNALIGILRFGLNF